MTARGPTTARRPAKTVVLVVLLALGALGVGRVITTAPVLVVGSAAVDALDAPAAVPAAAGGPLSLTGIQLVGADPHPPADPIGLTVAYDGGNPGDVIRADWSVDGRALRQLRIVVARSGAESVVTSYPPAGGSWPVGQHRIVLSLPTGVIGETTFRVG